ncbi:MAG: hypothetical protein CMH56_15370 [Myxococcales bacterium]|nr:hypothetical protein [Myxococcales bacterium]|tara:strand:+ start:2261 stop:3460 length:1200 start_codon:yes stop_codon:yes gene_type:complete
MHWQGDVLSVKKIISESQIVVVVGSGGVGKTTSACGLALASARTGKKVALLTIDPAKRLAQALGLDALNNQPQALHADLVGEGAVDAMMLEPAETFDNLIRSAVATEALGEKLLKNRLYQLIARTLGGMQEYMAVEKLYDLTESQRYDMIVVDTPPSVNALVFLDAPRRMYTFFSDKIVRFFVREEKKKSNFIKRMKDKVGDVAISVLRKTLSETFMDDLIEMATAFQSLFVTFRRRGETVERLLRARGTNFVLVTGPDPLRVQEASDYLTILRQLGVDPNLWIVNRVHCSPDKECSFEDSDVQEWIDAFSPEEEAAFADMNATSLCKEFNAAAQLATDLKQRDDLGLRQIKQLIGGTPMIRVEAFTEEVEDGQAVEQFVQALNSFDQGLTVTQAATPK